MGRIGLLGWAGSCRASVLQQNVGRGDWCNFGHATARLASSHRGAVWGPRTWCGGVRCQLARRSPRTVRCVFEFGRHWQLLDEPRARPEASRGPFSVLTTRPLFHALSERPPSHDAVSTRPLYAPMVVFHAPVRTTTPWSVPRSHMHTTFVVSVCAVHAVGRPRQSCSWRRPSATSSSLTCASGTAARTAPCT